MLSTVFGVGIRRKIDTFDGCFFVLFDLLWFGCLFDYCWFDLTFDCLEGLFCGTGQFVNFGGLGVICGLIVCFVILLCFGFWVLVFGFVFVAYLRVCFCFRFC